MKRLFILVITICLMFLSTQGYADIATYYLNLGTLVSGNTTVPDGGVSTMAVRGGTIPKSGASEFKVGQNPGYCIAEISGITASQSQQGAGGNYDDTKFSLFFKNSLLNHADHWAAAKRQRLFYDTKLSGHTKYQKSLSIPPGNFVQLYWETSGATVFDGATVKLVTGLPAHYYEPKEEKVYLLYLGTADSGNSTQPSSTGVSNMLVDGEKYKRSESTYVIDDTEKLVGDYFGFQIDTLTIGQAAEALGNYSGNTVTFRYKETMIDETAHWEAALYIDIITAMALSGNTRYQVQIYPEALGFIRFYMAPSGVTAFDFAKAKFITR